MKPTLRKWIVELFLTVFFATVVFVGYQIYLQKDMPTGPAPHVKTHLLSGTTIDLHTMSETKPVLVYFWASWCRVCQWTSPSVSELAKDDRFHVVTVALASGTDERIHSYLMSKNTVMPVINDDDGILSRQWRVSVTPSFFIIREGEIKTLTTGYTTKTGLLARLLVFR